MIEGHYPEFFIRLLFYALHCLRLGEHPVSAKRATDKLIQDSSKHC